tara:strand:+ start:1124 stop:1399 length:276 start_codon:yes stop_codon:yes gene_type:complete
VKLKNNMYPTEIKTNKKNMLMDPEINFELKEDNISPSLSIVSVPDDTKIHIMNKLKKEPTPIRALFKLDLSFAVFTIENIPTDAIISKRII